MEFWGQGQEEEVTDASSGWPCGEIREKQYGAVRTGLVTDFSVGFNDVTARRWGFINWQGIRLKFVHIRPRVYAPQSEGLKASVTHSRLVLEHINML